MVQTSLLPSSPIPDAEHFRYSSARIKVLETRLLSESDFLRFKNLSPQARIQSMRDVYPWFTSDDFETQAGIFFYDVLDRFSSECNSPDLATFFLVPKAMSQIQMILEGAPRSKCPVPLITEFTNTRDLQTLPEPIKTAASETKIFYDSGDKGEARRHLTNWLITMLSGSRFIKLPYFTDVVKHWIDLLSCRLLISTIIRKGTFQGLKGGTFEIQSNMDFIQLSKVLGIDDPSPFAIEIALDEKLFKAVSRARQITAGPEVIFAYFWELEREIRNAAMLLAGAHVAIPPEELERAYRRTYAT